jgi:hypothetical protein
METFTGISGDSRPCWELPAYYKKNGFHLKHGKTGYFYKALIL